MMRPAWSVPLALVLMALFFFSITITPFSAYVLQDLGHSFGMNIPPLAQTGIHTILGFLSLCGGIAFLALTRKENPSWYLGIPLVLAFAVVALSPAMMLLVVCDPNPSVYFLKGMWSLLAACGLFLFPPCAALFFWSQRRLGKGVTGIAGAALVITLCTILLITYHMFYPSLAAAGLIPPEQPQYIDGHLVKSHIGLAGGILFLILQYIGPLVLGICFLVLAALSWREGRRTTPVPPAPRAAP